MPVEVELKLQDLARIALGAPELTNVNIAVLHSLIDIFLKKLNCQNETIALSSFESKHLEHILQSSKISPLAFNDDNVELIAEKLERLQKLEHDINDIDSKLNKHLQEVQRADNLAATKLDWDSWQSYGLEDLCTICDPDNEIACKLLKNTDFLKKLLRRISSPMVERIFHFEDKLKTLNEEFMAFIKRAEEEYLKIQLLETCIYEIELLRKKINENQTQFICTMEEVQDMLDAKLDKIHMPALKKYIKDHFRSIDDSIKALQSKKECPKAAGIIMEGVRCMSCGGTNVCSEVGVQPTAMLPDVKVKKTAKLLKYCGCTKYLSIGRKGMKYSAKPLNLSKSSSLKSKKPSNRVGSDQCRKAEKKFDFLEGFDGNLYRKG